MVYTINTAIYSLCCINYQINNTQDANVLDDQRISYMGRYIIKRICQFIPVFLGVTLILFILQNVVPGDPIKLLAGEKKLDETTDSRFLMRMAIPSLRHCINGTFFTLVVCCKATWAFRIKKVPCQ